MRKKQITAALMALTIAATSLPVNVFAETRVVEPTCTEAGYTESEDTGELLRYDETAALGHEEGDWVIVNTEEYKQGKGSGTITTYEKRCTRCDEILDTKTEDVFTLPATCEDAGYTEIKVNDEVVSHEDIDALGHELGEWTQKGSWHEATVGGEEGARECEYIKRCNICNKIVERTSVFKKTTSETCITDGKIIYTFKDSPEDNYEKIIPATGHKWEYSDSKQSITKGSDGAEIITTKEYRKCKTCGAEECYDTRVSKTKNPTCTEDGYYSYESSANPSENYFFKKEANGHRWHEELIKQGTLTQPEVYEYTCADCGAKKTVKGKTEDPFIRFDKGLIMDIGKTKKVAPDFIWPEDSIVKCKTNNKKVATATVADKTHVKVKALKTGKASITVTTKYGASYTFNVFVATKDGTVYIGSTPNSLKATVKNKKSITLKKSKTAQIKTVVKPVTTKFKVRYASSNKKVATVTKKGKIKAKKKGTCTITVTCAHLKKKIKVKVK